ncbi:hypothetical protein, partial [Corynebacterium canis]
HVPTTTSHRRHQNRNTTTNPTKPSTIKPRTIKEVHNSMARGGNLYRLCAVDVFYTKIGIPV